MSALRPPAEKIIKRSEKPIASVESMRSVTEKVVEMIGRQIKAEVVRPDVIAVPESVRANPQPAAENQPRSNTSNVEPRQSLPESIQADELITAVTPPPAEAVPLVVTSAPESLQISAPELIRVEVVEPVPVIHHDVERFIEPVVSEHTSYPEAIEDRQVLVATDPEVRANIEESEIVPLAASTELVAAPAHVPEIVEVDAAVATLDVYTAEVENHAVVESSVEATVSAVDEAVNDESAEMDRREAEPTLEVGAIILEMADDLGEVVVLETFEALAAVISSVDSETLTVEIVPEANLFEAVEDVEIEPGMIEAVEVSATVELPLATETYEAAQPLREVADTTETASKSMPNRFEDFIESQPTPERPATIEQIQVIAEAAAPLEEILAVLSIYLAEATTEMVHTDLTGMETVVDSDEVLDAEVIKQLIQEIYTEAYPQQQVSGITAEYGQPVKLTENMTRNLLLLLQATGYKDPQGALLEFVGRYDFEFLMQAIEHLYQLSDRANRKEFYATSVFGTDDNAEPLAIRIGKAVFGQLRLSPEFQSLVA